MILAVMCCAIGCETKAQTGALAGAGVGAIVGQAIGHNTAGTLIGVGVGTGVGYLIGSEADKADAKKKTVASAEEMKPFAGTSWKLESINPPPAKPAKSVVARSGSDGMVTTTRTYEDGKEEKGKEKYRVVGDTLIVNKPDYIVNAKYKIEGDKLYLSSANKSAVLTRI